MSRSYHWSTCPVCGEEYQLGWQSFRARWPRWLALFLGVWMILTIWYSVKWVPAITRDLRLLHGLTACFAFYWSFIFWVCLNAGQDAKLHKACLKPEWTMWLVPLVVPLSALAAGAAVGGAVYLAVWGIQYFPAWLWPGLVVVLAIVLPRFLGERRR